MSDLTLIVGAGPMAVAYAKVLQELKKPFIAVGRGEASAAEFNKETGVQPLLGGWEAWTASGAEKPARAIVAVSEQNLGTATLAVLKAGIPSVLVEKPGGFLPEDIRQIAREAESRKARVFVGYNRRFYSSTQTARQMIKNDGGVSSFSFEFTEWGHVIEKKVCPQPVKDEWFLHNSTHVIDTAFYLGGLPKSMSCHASGSLSWHPRGAKYTGSGVSETGALFAYHANWGAPGRWAIEVLTPKNRYIFKPMEKLQVTKLGSVAVEEIPLEDELDKKFKPGVFRQTEAFLKEDGSILPTIQEQVKHLPFYEKMERGE